MGYTSPIQQAKAAFKGGFSAGKHSNLAMRLILDVMADSRVCIFARSSPR
jgi:hypothetical protein